MATAKKVCESLPQMCLDSTVSNKHIAELAKSMTKWRELAPFLKLTEAEEEEIVEQHQGDLWLQKRKALQKWKEKNGGEATYRRLIVIFCAQGRADLAETLKSLLPTSNNKSLSASTVLPSQNVIDEFHGHLCKWYTSLRHPSTLQWPDSSNECYVKLELLDSPLKGDREERSDQYKRISLESIFTAGNSKAKRKIVLIEGVAGAGKTTLSWFACKEWAAGRLFKDIKLLIHVSLSDRMLHSASKLADLIPHPSEEMRTIVANAIAGKHDRGICFWFEGCDETPWSFWESFLYRFVAGTGSRSMLPDAHIILTSRPAGIPAPLANCLTGKVIIKGFHSVLDYISILKLEDENLLLEALEMKPELYSLCHLPLNAVILVYLHNFKDKKLPSTRTGLFDLFVRNFLLRHLQTRTTYCEVTIINNIQELPNDILLSFLATSKLAYRSLLEKKEIDPKMLSEFGLDDIDNTFGFLQVHETLTTCGIRKQFTFMHLSLQEYLAAFHISQMDKHQQVEAVKLVFDQNPLSPVLIFYAGLTGLNIAESRNIILKVLNKSIDIDDIVKNLGLSDSDLNTVDNVNPAHDLRRHLLALMTCMYESQNVNLFAHVNLPKIATQFSDKVSQEVKIRLLGMLLYPADCLAIGYFIRHAISQTKFNSLVLIDCSYCLLGDMEMKALAIELQKPAFYCINAGSMFCFYDVFISARAIDSLAALVSPGSCVRGLDIDGELIEDITLLFKYCIERLMWNLRTIQFGVRSICYNTQYNPNIIYYLILLLRCPCLKNLSLLFCNHLLFANPTATALFCETVKYSSLYSLNLSGCGIGDNSLVSLMTALCHEGCTVEFLILYKNRYSDHGLTCSLRLLLKNSPLVQLRKLSVDHVSDDHIKLSNSINRRREQYGQPELIIEQNFLFTLRQINYEEKAKGIALLQHYMFMRPDLALQSLHHHT